MCGNFSVVSSLFSDHNLLKLSFFFWGKRNDVFDLANRVNPVGTNGVRIKWSGVNPCLIMRKIVVSNQKEITYCLHEEIMPLLVTDNFCNITKSIKSILTKIPGPSCTKKKGWFDGACTKALHGLKHTLSKSPRDLLTIQILRHEYKIALSARKKILKDEAWENLVIAAKTKNNKLFGETVNAPFLKSDNIPEFCSFVSSDKWVNHFSDIFNNNGEMMTVHEGLSGGGRNLPLNITNEEVIQAIQASAGGRAPGPYGVPADLFTSTPILWGPSLTRLFNSAAIDTIPKTWGESIIIPIFKKGDKADPRNYRPISLLDTALKVMSRVLLLRLEEWAIEYSVLTPVQFGFRKRIVTIEQCTNLALLIGKYTRAKACTIYLCFSDLSSAFDLVDHNLLWPTLISMGAPRAIVGFLSCSYENLTSQVRFGPPGECSSKFKVGRGIRQGCVFAPILFSLFINGTDN